MYIEKRFPHLQDDIPNEGILNFNTISVLEASAIQHSFYPLFYQEELQ